MALVMTKDKKVRPLELGDLKDVAARDERIRQLEALNALLAEQVDRMRPVVEAAHALSDTGLDKWINLYGRIQQYDAEMALLSEENQ